jgi:multidrug efflux pump subunit AcrA (membrane-fusion protein)
MKSIALSRLLVPAVAAAGLVATVLVVASGDRAYPVQPPVAAPATAPYANTIAGAGIIEASSRNIALATPLPGIVARVFVEAGDRVAAGAPLFALDERPLAAELTMRHAALATAQARVREAEAQHLEAEHQFANVEALADPRAVSAEEIVRRRQAAEVARFKSGAKAVAHLRGDGGTRIPLRFVRVEPLVLPKKSLTSGSAERVDTRVLQVLFAFERGAQSVYVGQQVDVYIDAGEGS